MGTHYFSKNGVRISSQWWGQLYQDKAYRRVATDSVMIKIGGKAELFRIYTDWNGVDDRTVKSGPACIFETRVESPHAGWRWEADNLPLAQTIHAMVLAKLKDGEHPEHLRISTPLN
jgi:hypothetical protein